MRTEHRYTPDASIAQMMACARHLLHVSATSFYWVDETTRMHDYKTDGVPNGFIDRYRDGMHELDPLGVRRLAPAGSKVAYLSQERHRVTPEVFNRFSGFMASYDLVDNFEFVFWYEGAPFAGMGLLRRSGDRPIEPGAAETLALQHYFEFNMLRHPRFRQQRLKAVLSKTYGLTRREIEATFLLCEGASNQDIADAMLIGVATVKTYVLNILGKLGVDNRAAIVGHVMDLN